LAAESYDPDVRLPGSKIEGNQLVYRRLNVHPNTRKEDSTREIGEADS